MKDLSQLIEEEQREESKRAAARIRVRRYQATEKGKKTYLAAKRHYLNSEKGKAMMRRARRRYLHSPKGIAMTARVRQSDGYKSSRNRFKQSPKGKECIWRSNNSDAGKLRLIRSRLRRQYRKIGIQPSEELIQLLAQVNLLRQKICTHSKTQMS